MTDTTAPTTTAFDFDEAVFRLPEAIRADERYVNIHRQMVTTLLQEAEGLDLNMLQTLIVERIASGYVTMRYREDTGAWAAMGTNAEKDFRVDWRNLVSEFHKMLVAGEAQRRLALKERYQKILLAGLKKIGDDDERAEVRKFYLDEFSQNGE